MCVAGAPRSGLTSVMSMAMGRGPNLPQYSQSEAAKTASQAYDVQDERFKRWASEDLGKAGALESINQRVSAAETKFNQERESQMRSLGWRPQAEFEQQQAQIRNSPTFNLRVGRPNSGTVGQRALAIGSVAQNNPYVQQLGRQTFNAEQMRQDLIREATMDRIKSGVYSRGYQVTGTGQQSQATVVGGASGRRASTSGSPSSKSGGQVTTGPVGTKLNIGS
jgi:hypothetical protein